jgi:transposase
VTEVELGEEQVEVFIEHRSGGLHCPQCEVECSGYDHRRRSFRHLDTCQLKTILTVDIPRVKCPEHGVRQVNTPWAEPGSRFTAMFEALAIEWLREASILAVANRLRCSWDELDGIMQRAVHRGLARREREPVEHLAVDETAFLKRHEYVTVVVDAGRGGRVLHVADNRDRTALGSFYRDFEEQLQGLKSVSMDMWPAYIHETMARVDGAESKICFDRFHVAQHLGRAVNDVRKSEHRMLVKQGDTRLKGTRHVWLHNEETMTPRQQRTFEQLRGQALKVSRAWAIKEAARGLWEQTSRGWARRRWKKWLGWAMRSRLEPIKKAARMVRDHLYGIENAIALERTNAIAESRNARIQVIKKRSCGFRNRERFRNAIYFHLGGLDLKPAPTTHTVS